MGFWYLSNNAKQENAEPSSSTFVRHLTPQQHATVVELVGKRCTVKGEINGQQVDVLWDTGAQVSLISDQLVRWNFPGITVKNISELLNSELNLTAANGGEMPYIGWVELNFRLLSSKEELAFPFLVKDQSLDTPIIGFIDYFRIPHNTLCLPPKFCITYCLKMLLGKCNTPRSI